MRMRKFIVALVMLAFALTAAFVTPSPAQKRRFTPEGIWKGMLNNVSELQAMITALAVFDMKRLAAISDRFAAGQERLSKIPKFPAPIKKYYATLAETIKGVGDAARAGDDQMVAAKIGAILQVCANCHYDVRDAALRRK